MSGIAGIYNLDGRPADGSLLQRMTDVIAHRGPDGAGHWIHGPVALGHRMLHTTPESLLEQQPLTDESGTLCLTLDGRVDNREELRKALEDKGYPPRTTTDAEFVLRAYECWGEDCPAKILGDFAFALWDGRKRHLFCARDIMGLKPFYYYTDGRRFLFASELHQILEDAAVPRKPNEGLIAEYLSMFDQNLHETLFEGVLQLPRSEALIVRDGRVRTKRYWNIDWSREIRYRSDQEYFDHFREIFQEAVRSRLRSHRLVGAELSGGIDSSSVVCMAQWLFREGLAKNPGFETFSVSFPGQPWDERPYFQEVVEKWGLTANILTEGHPEGSAYIQQVSRYRDFPDFPYQEEMLSPVLALLQKKGARVLLSGDGGDQWFTGSLYHTADYLRSFRIGEAVRQSRMDSGILSQDDTRRSPFFVLLRYGLLPVLPRFARHGIQRALRKDGDGIPPWITPEFARRARLLERMRERDAANAQRIVSIVQREDLGAQLDYPYYWLIERCFSRVGIEYRSPLMDRRVIEFCLALPQDQLRSSGQTKRILRQAMAEFLPDRVRTRTDKAYYGLHTYRDALESLGGEQFFDSLQIASLGWVDAKQLQEMYQHSIPRFHEKDGRKRRYLWPLWTACGIELWYKAVFFEGINPLQLSTNVYKNITSNKERPWKKHPREKTYSSTKAS